MKISKLKGSNKSAGLCRMRIEGELTIYKAAEAMEQLIPYWNDFQRFEIDLSEITDIDTAGVQLLLIFSRKTEGMENGIRLLGTSQPVNEALIIYRLAPRFGIQSTFQQ